MEFANYIPASISLTACCSTEPTESLPTGLILVAPECFAEFSTEFVGVFSRSSGFIARLHRFTWISGIMSSFFSSFGFTLKQIKLNGLLD